MHQQSLILFAHGARDPRWAGPFERLKALLAQRRPDVRVDLAFLEFMTPDLPVAVAAAVEAGCASVTVVPVFLGQGGHVLRDLPVLITQLRTAHAGLQIEVAEAVGENPDVLQAIATYCAGTLADLAPR